MAKPHICQHTNLRLRDYLPCKFTEGGGKQCEREEEHNDDNHFFSMHTIMHERYGNGWACESFKEPVALFAEKELVKEKIRHLTEYLAELDGMPSVP
jgi:hypothetical protein